MEITAATEREMAKAYDPGQVEPIWLERWLGSGVFSGRVDRDRKPFFIACPPPNVTGTLHIGHAVNATIQDALSRARRMQGYAVLWQPGTDHAGIGTQTVVERQVFAKTGKSRLEIGRERFLEQIWAWKKEQGDAIVEQYRKLGASLDYSRWRFTMDEAYSRAVRTAFVRLYDKGLIYRGKRIINWCPRCLTSLSDLEVKHEAETGVLYHVQYPGEDGSAGLTIATVRPETILADVAVAVHPEDDRYRDRVGQRVKLPLTSRLVPIIADAYVEREFGTGALKITPGHDPNDFEIGLRHDLETIDILTPEGKMSAAAGPDFEGLDRFEAREVAVSRLKEEGLLVREETYSHQVGHCDRCHTVVEPRVSEQWWVKMAPLAGPAISAVQQGRIHFHPERFADVYLDWLQNVKDWCISRQLWWGHRIPIWTCPDGHAHASLEDLAVCPTCGKLAEQDPDVLDTWFSSALWPFATLGWPDRTPELDYFYPSHMLSTARDIMHLWVARMAFSSLEFLGQIPFHHVVIHATIMGRDGRRMSKSKGTGVDPLEVTARYGTDAFRFWAAGAGTSGQDVVFMAEKIEAARNFANKLWNAARFALMNLPEGPEAEALRAEAPPAGNQALEDRWIRTRLSEATSVVSEALDEFTLLRATDKLYEFVWSEFCDWWLEIAKPRLKAGDVEARRTLAEVLLATVKVMHPFMPFITEEIHAQLVQRKLAPAAATLLETTWPETTFRDAAAVARMNLVMEVVREVRRIRQELGVPADKVADSLVLQAEGDELAALQQAAATIGMLTRSARVEASSDRAEVPQAASAVVGQALVLLPLAGLLDLDRERNRLLKEIDAAKAEAVRLDGQLSNSAFTGKAPAHVVDKLKTRRTEVTGQLQALEERLVRLG